MKEGYTYYLLLINIAGFIFSTWDKQAAKHKRRRVRERTLWLTALAGGSGGLYLSMRIFRHKTKHRSFMVGVPILMIIQLLIPVVTKWLIK